MKRRLLVLCVLATALMGACGNLFDTAAAVVAGQKISTQEVSEGLELFRETEEYERLAQQGNIDAIERQVQQSYLSELIRREVLDNAAQEYGIEVPDAEVTEQIDAIKEDLGADFAEQLKENGLDEAQLELRVRYSLLQEKVRAEVTGDGGATDEEIEAFYEENLADYVASMRAQQILVPDVSLANLVSEQLQRASENEVDGLFERLAARHSIDKATARKGGDLGAIMPGDFPDPRLAGLSVELDIGEVSEPIRSPAGYHIIRVTEREITPLEDVSEAIAQELGEGEAEAGWQDWLRKAYEDSDIKINSRYGELDVETQTVVDATAEDIPGAVETPASTPTPSP